jgi:putative DNA primase/helicase
MAMNRVGAVVHARVDLEDSALCDSERYFNEGHFQPALLAQDLVDELTIITITSTKEIYAWENGCYVGGAEGESELLSWLKGILQGKLDKISRNHVAELMSQVRLRSFCPYEIFDSNLDLLPVKNGVLNTQIGEFEPYQKDKHYFLFQLPVQYDPLAKAPHFEKFVSEIVYPGDIPVVQEIFGYCLWRNGLTSMKKAVMLLGSGDNGKSLLLSVLTAMLGERNVKAITLTDLSENRFARAWLRGKLANINPDLPDKALKETGGFKGLVGDDVMPYEIKHGGGGEFVNRAKPIFSANKLPDANDDTDAYYTRWIILNFPYQFVRSWNEKTSSSIERPAVDKGKLKADLINDSELSGILNWALVGLKRLRENGRFTNELSSDKMREIYVKLANSLKAFVIDQCDVTGVLTDFHSKDELYVSYARYCQDKNLMPMTKEKVGRELPRCDPGKIVQGRDQIGKERPTTWRGIRLKKQDEPKADPKADPAQKKVDE